MGRFSISPQQLKYLQSDDDDDDDDDADDNVILHSHRDNNPLEYSSDEEDEDEHPLGFASASYGVTRFSLEPPPPSHLEVRRRYGWLDSDTTNGKDWASSTTSTMPQQYPPLSYHVSSLTAPATSLLLLRQARPTPDTSVDKISELLKAASMVDASPTPALLATATNRAASHVLKASIQGTRDRELIAKKQIDDLQRADLAHQQAAEALRSLLKRHHDDAKVILTQEKEHQKRLQELEQAKLEQEEQEQARLEAKEQARVQEQNIKEKQLHQLQEKQEQERQAVVEKQQAQEAAEAKKMEYVVKAKSLVAKLVQLRASVEPFESSKAVGKRRLHMKKVVKGKVNTLSTDPSKVQSVAMEVVQVIVDAKAEDEQMKQNPQATPEMSRGQRYLIDLLASTAMVRVQAEGFNGPRGDGFPLAHMLALVGHQANELIPVLSAHVYTVCPTAIPALPKLVHGETEEQLMESLGMIRNKEGEFETFARFLARTEGIISIVASIMASTPSDHTMFGGHKGAIEWLQRFLGLLPKARATLPLLTAPVLDAFLTAAGHMMARVFPNEFRPLLQQITTDIITRLDEGPIGAPRSLRLKLVVKVGFSGFQSNLPSRALAPLYYTGGSGGGLPQITASTGSLAPINAFGGGAPAASPFGGAPAQAPGPFGATTLFGEIPAQAPSAFGGTPSQAPTGTTAFGGSAAQAPSPFASTPAQASSPFGGTTPFGGAFAQAPSPFGATSPFGGAPAQALGPFGGAPVQAPTAFGTTTPFGGAPVQAPNQFGATAPFGGGTGGFAPAFTSAPSAFGSTPFGGQQQSSQSPFGKSNSSNNQGSSGGGGGGGGGKKGPCRFFAQGTCRNGDNCQFSHETPGGSGNGYQQQGSAPFVGQPFGAQSNNSPFGQQQPQQSTPFGGPAKTPFGQQQSTPFGASSNSPFGQQQSTPFGNPTNNMNSNPSPFGGGGGNSGFGRNNNQSRYQGGNSAGGGNQKAPCRFFAQGTCRNGDNCQFSHDSPSGSGNSGGFGGASPFGGPRR